MTNAILSQAKTTTVVTSKKEWEIGEQGLKAIICQWFADHSGEDIKPSDIEFGPAGNYYEVNCTVTLTEEKSE